MLALDIYNTFYGRIGDEGVGPGQSGSVFPDGGGDCIPSAQGDPKQGGGAVKNESKGWRGILLTAFLTVLAIFFLIPVFLVLMNSLKGQFYISDAPFALPNSETFVGLRNYWNGIEKVDFFSAFGYSAFITLFSVAAIVLFTAMTAWYLVRAGTRAANGLYYLFVFSMIVPFQMVMFTMSKMANLLRLG